MIQRRGWVGQVHRLLLHGLGLFNNQLPETRRPLKSTSHLHPLPRQPGAIGRHITPQAAHPHETSLFLHSILGLLNDFPGPIARDPHHVVAIGLHVRRLFGDRLRRTLGDNHRLQILVGRGHERLVDHTVHQHVIVRAVDRLNGFGWSRGLCHRLLERACSKPVDEHEAGKRPDNDGSLIHAVLPGRLSRPRCHPPVGVREPRDSSRIPSPA